MDNVASCSRITLLDTTMRDGELAPGVQLNIYQKVRLAKLLEEMRIDIIEVGYPGAFPKDFDELFMVAKQVKEATVCGLASMKSDEIISVALALKPAVRGRIHVFTPVNLLAGSQEAETLDLIRQGVTLSRNYCPDVEWSAFDATRSHPDFLCKAVEVAIASGATTINIPDSLGTSSPTVFADLITLLMNRVPNIDQATISTHCHDDLGLAVENSLAALDRGVRQIECSINGIGARKGNADLKSIVDAIANHPHYYTNAEIDLLDEASAVLLASQTAS